MIKYFRKIRRKLLSEGKIGKYLKYAIGEIFLVVIGILIALSINSWNDNRISNTKQHDYLIGLKNDLENQITSINSLDQFYDSIIKTSESILKDFASSEELSNIDSINQKLSFLMFTNNYPEITTTFNELNSTGQLNLIKGNQLRSQVIKFYQSSKQTEKLVNSNTKLVIYEQIFPIIKSMIIILPENFDLESEKINLRDKLKTTFENNLNNSNKVFELINAINLRIVVTKSNKINIENIKNEAEQLLEGIKAELIIDL